MKLIMNRNGDFTCNWSSMDNMCGTIATLNPVYSYSCVIETGDILDKQDFVFDQLNVDKYFQDKYKAAPYPPHTNSRDVRRHKPRSCERIAIDAVNNIREMLEKHMLGHADMSVIYRIAVTISFGPKHASITAEWRPDAAKEIANVKKRVKPVERDKYGNLTFNRTGKKTVL